MKRHAEQSGAVRSILICGGGLAASMIAAALIHQLGDTVRIRHADIVDMGDSDLFYGNVTGPDAYAFNLAAGIDEPMLILRSETSFSWGTRYEGWSGRSWMQCFALPLPVIDGVLFHHYLARAGIDGIEPFLVAAAAAARNGFAHPPSAAGDRSSNPMARAEYGYQYDPASYARVFADAVALERIEGRLGRVAKGPDGITALFLTDGRELTADLYIDASGPDAHLLSSLAKPDQTGRRLAVTAWDGAARPVDRPYRRMIAMPGGWRGETPLRDRIRHLAGHLPGEEPPTTGGVTAETALGQRDRAWIDNCVALGHAAGVIEPISPAPMMMLQRDITRLLTLIPGTTDMRLERREYNRRFVADRHHAALFDQALFLGRDFPDTPFWQSAKRAPIPDALARKLDLFERRGVLVAYDLEPFHPEDWTIQHMGMGRRPAGYDRLADRMAISQVHRLLTDMRQGIARAVGGLPPADVYRAQLEHYLRTRR